MKIFIKAVHNIFSSYEFTDSIILFFSYLKLLVSNRVKFGNKNRESFMGFDIEFPYRPAFFGLIHEIFLNPFVFIKKDKAQLTVFDCGTNIGIRMLYLKWRYPNAKFVCFEPNPVVFDYLSRNIKNNNLSSSVIVHQVALGGVEGEIELFYNENIRASGSATVIKPEIRGNSQISKMVPQKRLSDYIVTKVDFLKIDIEGAEGEVVEDLKRNNKLSLISKILIEYHLDNVTMTYPLEKIISILESANFKCEHSPLEVFRSQGNIATLSTCMIYGEKQLTI